mgnify:CR=1 FL=1
MKEVHEIKWKGVVYLLQKLPEYWNLISISTPLAENLMDIEHKDGIYYLTTRGSVEWGLIKKVLRIIEKEYEEH